MDIIFLLFATVVVIDWFFRIVYYRKNHNPKYKHQHFCWTKDIKRTKTYKEFNKYWRYNRNV